MPGIFCGAASGNAVAFLPFDGASIIGREFLMKKKLYVGVLGCLVALCALLLTTQSALAHEKRHVGKYTFVVGFLDEPAYANIKNGLDLTICTGDACTYSVPDGQKVVSNPG